MLDIKFIRQNKKEVEEACLKRGVKIDLNKLLKLDEERRKLIKKIDDLKKEKKKLGKEKIEESKKKKELIKKLEADLSQIEKDFLDLMYKVPNILSSDVLDVNQEIKRVGEIKEGKVKEYLEIVGEMIDIERGAKVAGSRFYYLKGKVALLELKLINFAINFLTNKENIKKVIKEKNLPIPDKPFLPVVPPLMLKPEIMKGMGYLDQAPDETYFIEKDNLYLIGTAEHSLIALHANEILKEDDLPLRYVAFPCSSFRREAGSYGKDVRGIFRVHQFEKVEMVSFCLPEKSSFEHELLLGLEEEMMKLLEIPYRVVKLSASELSYPSVKTYDIEAWFPSQKKYREVASSSNCTDFQARRLKIRYKNKEGENIFVHTLNATALAMPRMIISIIENYQKEDGTFDEPRILK
jgi:seryl-tRNA synthetase